MLQLVDEATLQADRDMLVRFCARYTGDAQAAEDLVQQTLLRACQHGSQLRAPDTREVLIRRYIQDCPQAEVAERLGFTEGAVEAHLHRGKLSLRRLLTNELSAEAISFGLISPDDAGWADTRVWCPGCGNGKLVA